MPPADWNPAAYARFAGLRLQPALDLLARISELPAGKIVDLGCGAGAVGPVLRRRFPNRTLAGLDASPAMLAEARATGAYDRLEQADAAAWTPAAPPALIFSNAALHWLPDHAALMPRLAGLLAPGGVMAVQMPRQQEAPSHRLLGSVAKVLFPSRFARPEGPPRVAAPQDYLRLLAPLGDAAVWEVEYLQRLVPAEGAHPVRLFTQSTAFRPYEALLSPEERTGFLAAYDAALAAAYPPESDGSVLFPFRRLFLTLQRPG